ncbi:MAG: sensor domain-containing diguanylate cyclase [Xanthomonadales bacterium]|nr:sensor domain-containing diguanylate cyclase [Xanthomonadales bacterium]
MHTVYSNGAEERFDRLTRLAKRLFDVPVALVNLSGERAKSKAGVSTGRVSIYVTLCSEINPEDQCLVVPDVRTIGAAASHPLVLGEPGIRFYVGVPLYDETGQRLGMLCLLDRRIRTLDADEIGLLDDLASLAEQELIARQLASMDELTELSNRRGFMMLASHAIGVCRRLRRSACLFFFDLDNLKQINDVHGHAEGDRALKRFADALKTNFRDSDVIGRLGGDEFVVFMTGTCEEEAGAAIERLKATVADIESKAPAPWRLSFSTGVMGYRPGSRGTLEELLESADREMYRQKRRNRGNS